MEKEKKAFYDLAEIKAIPLQEICRALEIPVKRKGNSDWFSIRPEREPSCKIYPTNTYSDFGDGNRGGSGIDLVAAVQEISPEAAIAWIGETFGLRPLNHVRGKGELTDRQYAAIGIQADLATKNFSFDLETYSEEQTREFAEKYRMPVQQLAKEYPEIYHNMLKRVSLPVLQEARSDYYSELYLSDKEAKLWGRSFSWSETAEEKRQKVERCEQILRRAIQDTKLLRFQWRAYDIKTDLERIRSGELSWQFDGNVPYAALKENAPKKGERIRYQEIPFETYYMNDVYSRFLSEIDIAVFVRGDKVNIAYYGSSQPVMDLVGEYCRSCEQDQRQGIGRD